MKNMMYRLMRYTLCVAILFTMVIVPESAQAETLGQLREKVNKLEADYQAQKKEEENTKNKVEQNKVSIADLQANITNLEKEIHEMETEIREIEKEITEKEKEIKSIISFMQVSNGENAYLEYAMGAKDFTDFIYRMSVSEQLADYNKSLTKEYESMIEKNEEKKKELAEKKKQLNEEKKKLEEENKQMYKHLDEVAHIKMDIEEEIRLQKEAIRNLENMGCRSDQDKASCMAWLAEQANQKQEQENANGGGGTLPPAWTGSTAFARPIVRGYVTSEYGWRCLPSTGCTLHEAMDVAQTGYVPIYAAAPGVVIGTRVKSSCGGNMIFILHTVNGKKYTTEYAHLRSINVKVGQYVTANTQIAVMGGDKNIEYWDNCSSVQHLHFGVATGHYLVDYLSWNDFLNHTINPRKVVNFPWSGGTTDYFADRTTIY